MSAGHGHEEHGHHVDLESIVKLTDTLQHLDSDALSKKFEDKLFVVGADDIFSTYGRKKVTGNDTSEVTKMLFDSLGDLVLQEELKFSPEALAKLKSIPALKDPKSGTTKNLYDDFVAEYIGIDRQSIYNHLNNQEMSPRLLKGLMDDLYKKFIGRTQERIFQGSIKTNEDAEKMLTYLREVQQEEHAPSQLKAMDIPEYKKSGLNRMETIQLYAKAIAAMGEYKPLVGKAHGPGGH